MLVLITGLGWLSRYVLGQYFGGLAERFILSIPGVNTVYTTVKQLVETFGTQNRNLFSRSCCSNIRAQASGRLAL